MRKMIDDFNNKVFECCLDFIEKTFTITCEGEEIAIVNALPGSEFVPWAFCQDKGDSLTLLSIN